VAAVSVWNKVPGTVHAHLSLKSLLCRPNTLRKCGSGKGHMLSNVGVLVSQPVPYWYRCCHLNFRKTTKYLFRADEGC
jgi:hypothetical protein